MNPSRIAWNPIAIVRDMVTAMRLLADSRVPLLLKLGLPGAALLYLLSPIDLLPDLALGFGQLDDVAVVILLLRLFVQAAPSFAVNDARSDDDSDDSNGFDGPTLDGEWSVLDDQ